MLPGRLRSQVEAIHDSTVTLESGSAPVDAGILLVLARACRETERVTFAYAGPRGSGERRVEPYRLVATGRRWYLLVYGLDREDWRTFRIDRITSAESRGWRFRPRDDAPDAADHVRRSISRDPYDRVCGVRIEAPKSAVDNHLPVSVGTVTADGRSRSILDAATRMLRAAKGLAAEGRSTPERPSGTGSAGVA